MFKFKNFKEKAILKSKEKRWFKDLLIVTSYLEHSKVKYWIEGGNLLAIVRDKKLLPHSKDSDIDLGMEWNKEQFYKIKNIRETMKFHGFKTNVSYFGIEIINYRGNKIFRSVLSRLSRFGLDFSWFTTTPISISFFRKSNGYFWNTWVNKPGVDFAPRVVPEKFYNNIDTIEFKGHSFPVPYNYLEYLSYKYGQDWNTKKINWTYYIDDGTIDKSWIDSKTYQNW